MASSTNESTGTASGTSSGLSCFTQRVFTLFIYIYIYFPFTFVYFTGHFTSFFFPFTFVYFTGHFYIIFFPFYVRVFHWAFLYIFSFLLRSCISLGIFISFFFPLLRSCIFSFFFPFTFAHFTFLAISIICFVCVIAGGALTTVNGEKARDAPRTLGALFLFVSFDGNINMLVSTRVYLHMHVKHFLHLSYTKRLQILHTNIL